MGIRGRGRLDPFHICLSGAVVDKRDRGLLKGGEKSCRLISASNARRINLLDVCTGKRSKESQVVRGNFHCRSKIRVASMAAARYK